MFSLAQMGYMFWIRSAYWAVFQILVTYSLNLWFRGVSPSLELFIIMLDTSFLCFKENKKFFYVLSFSFIRKFLYLSKYGTIFASCYCFVNAVIIKLHGFWVFCSQPYCSNKPCYFEYTFSEQKFFLLYMFGVIAEINTFVGLLNRGRTIWRKWCQQRTLV